MQIQLMQFQSSFGSRLLVILMLLKIYLPTLSLHYICTVQCCHTDTGSLPYHTFQHKRIHRTHIAKDNSTQNSYRKVTCEYFNNGFIVFIYAILCHSLPKIKIMKLISRNKQRIKANQNIIIKETIRQICSSQQQANINDCVSGCLAVFPFCAM